jgi:predicted transcriptional regulator
MPQIDILTKTAELLSSFVSHNSVRTGDLPALFETIHTALAKLESGAETPGPNEPAKEPAVSIRRSITPDFLICLEDGKRFKSLKRHLAAHGLTAQQYREKWKLPSDYPMVAPNYAAARSVLAKKIGLGQAAAGARKRRLPG